jgi:hypothetical protein
MTNEQFLDCLRQLKLSRASARTAAAFGLSVRQLQRIAAGHARVTPTLALLAIAYLKRGGVPNHPWNPDGVSTTDAMRAASAMLMDDLYGRGGKVP